jgi:hypothetical protein
VVKEIYRAKKTLGGITDAAKVFPDQELLITDLRDQYFVTRPRTRLLEK